MPNKISTFKENYYDHETLERYFNAPGSRVHDGPVLKGRLEELALNDVRVATLVLQAIKFGRIDIFRHERLLDWFQQYHYWAQQSSNTQFAKVYFETMDAIGERVETWFNYREYHNVLSKARLNDYFAFGSSAVIAKMLMGMRFFCNKEAFKHWASMYGRNANPQVVERPGTVRLFLDSPRDSEFADNFEGDYIYGAKIARVQNQDKWEIIFEDYFPNHKYRSVMWTLMYRAVAPLVEPLFMARVYSAVEWQFTD